MLPREQGESNDHVLSLEWVCCLKKFSLIILKNYCYLKRSVEEQLGPRVERTLYPLFIHVAKVIQQNVVMTYNFVWEYSAPKSARLIYFYQYEIFPKTSEKFKIL